MKSSWLSKKYFHKFKTDPKRTVKGFRIDAIEDVRCNISINQAARAKKLAILKLQGDPSAQYALLWDYADEVKRSNPGSTVILGTNQNLFDRFYVCLHALRMNFLAGCRPVICVDGCHLKGHMGGDMEWFLTLLKMDLHIENDCNYTFMSDKQKGLVGALQELFPNAEHRFCVRHLHSNFKSNGFRGLAFKNGLWKAARATTVNQFNERMKELKDLDEGAYAWFNDKPPKEWSRSHFSNYSRKWDLSGIPCKHAVSAIFCQGEDIEKYTHQCYRVQTYLKAYQHPIFPINGRDEWKKSDLSPPVPPKPVKRVGRPPKSSRRLEVDEPVQKNKKRRGAPMKEGSSRIKRQQTTVKCGKCGGQGHNARGCATKTASNEPVPDASSQVPPTEQPQKKQVRRKCKGTMQDPDVVMHRRTRSLYTGKKESIVASVQEEDGVMHRRTRSGHIPVVAPVIRKLQDRKTPKPSATAPTMFHQFQQCQKGVKIKEPAPFIDVEVGGRSLDEQGSSGSTPSIVKGGKKFVSMSNISNAISELNKGKKAA
ncbi:UNVERIFIED_CONTAM: hypothetical protein Scaly_2477100 [Sesamum calycinum]|uniref:CCHC-type domain-containing protein n=1 Tax=Sesamum calycinum TaxID=2727403 RepID=A0AAW2LU33_9LAMI